MCIGCYEEHGSPRVMNDAVVAAAALIRNADHYGPLHIFVDDWNAEDSHIDFCAGEAEQRGTELDKQIIALVQPMSHDERLTALALAAGYIAG